MKFRNHPSVTVIKNMNNNLSFNFCRVSVEDVIREIKKLSTQRTTQILDLLLKGNSDIFVNYISDFFNACEWNLLSVYKHLQTLHQSIKNDTDAEQTIIGQWTFFQLFKKYLRKFHGKKLRWS